jgi:hypothetical protein
MLGQAIYYLITGFWPLAHLASFERISGPKQDDWLVKMVGLLTATIGLTLLFAFTRGKVTWEIRFLAIFSALAYAAIDIFYSFTGVVSPLYLVDAFLEFLFISFLLLSRKHNGAAISHR